MSKPRSLFGDTWLSRQLAVEDPLPEYPHTCHAQRASLHITQPHSLYQGCQQFLALPTVSQFPLCHVHIASVPSSNSQPPSTSSRNQNFPSQPAAMVHPGLCPGVPLTFLPPWRSAFRDAGQRSPEQRSPARKGSAGWDSRCFAVRWAARGPQPPGRCCSWQ